MLFFETRPRDSFAHVANAMKLLDEKNEVVVGGAPVNAITLYVQQHGRMGQGKSSAEQVAKRIRREFGLKAAITLVSMDEHYHGIKITEFSPFHADNTPPENIVALLRAIKAAKENDPGFINAIKSNSLKAAVLAR